MIEHNKKGRSFLLPSRCIHNKNDINTTIRFPTISSKYLQIPALEDTQQE